MKRPGVPADEAARSEELREHHVLDTGADEALDAVTRTVSRLLDVPIALVSLIDVERQWFKSRHGIDATETPRDESFCGHVVADAAPLVVRDAHEDERFFDNPFVLGDPKVRFYAGYPLRTEEGHDLGTLCAIDRRPRAPTDAELATLADLSRVAVALLAAHRNRARLERKRVQLDEQARLLAARGELLATISHEIRTPLHGVVGIANVLAESELAPDQRDLVETLVRSAGTVRRIVDDVLDLARAESNKLPIDPRETDVWTLLEDVVDLHASDVGARGVEIGLVLDEGARLALVVDGTRLSQIVSNLVENAAKFTREGAIVVRGQTRRGSSSDRVTLTLAVEDTGPGFPADAIERPFAAFSQPDPALARLHGGSGLGLSLADDLARRMGGELKIDATYRRGARVVLTLPDLRVVSAAPEDRAREVVRGLAVGLGALERDALRTALRGVPELALEVVEDVSALSARGARFVLAPLGRATLGAFEAGLGGAALSHAASPGSVASVPPGAATALRLPFRRSRLTMLARQFHAPVVTRAAEAESASPPAPLRAFVVDDDPTSTRLLAALLRRRGVLVTTYSDGLEALAACREGSVPDLIFSDLHMPGMNGLALATRIRAEVPRPPRLVVVSATVREDDRRRCREAGFEAFLQKPLSTTELDAIVGAKAPSAVSAVPEVVAGLREVGARSIAALDARIESSDAAPPHDPLPVVRIAMGGDVSGDRLLRRLDAASAAASSRHTLLIDGRASMPTDPSVGSALERWYRSPPPTVAKIALLVENRLWIPHIEARSEGSPVPMRAFEHEADALRWLGEH